MDLKSFALIAGVAVALVASVWAARAARAEIRRILLANADYRAVAEELAARLISKVRTIAAIFTHMHNARCKWVRLTAPHLKVPQQLNRTHCTPQQARTGLAKAVRDMKELMRAARA